ncbi:hypothetical protein KEM56_000852, partial [Ascosphaera pollenicola]
MDFQPHIAFGSSVDSPNGSTSALSFLDTGATSNFMSESYAMRCGLQTKDLSSPIPLKTADDQIFYMVSQTAKCTFHVETLSFYLAPLPHYDCVLGLPWMWKHVIQFNPCSCSITFKPHVCGPLGCLPFSRNGVRSLTVFAKKPSTLAKIVDPSIKALSALSFLCEAEDPDAEVFLVSCSREKHTTANLAATASPVMGAADTNTYA